MFGFIKKLFGLGRECPRRERLMPIGRPVPGVPDAIPRVLQVDGWKSPEEAAAFFSDRRFEKDGVKYIEIWYEESEDRPNWIYYEDGSRFATSSVRCVTKRELRVYRLADDGSIILNEDTVVQS